MASLAIKFSGLVIKHLTKRKSSPFSSKFYSLLKYRKSSIYLEPNDFFSCILSSHCYPLLHLFCCCLTAVANQMKAQADRHPIFSKICVSLGQNMHYITTKINVISSGYKFIGVKPLDHETALKDGSICIPTHLIHSLLPMIQFVHLQVYFALNFRSECHIRHRIFRRRGPLWICRFNHNHRIL